MGSLVELLGVERTAETQGDALAEENVVGEGSNTTVVDLDLYFGTLVSRKPLFVANSILRTLVKETGSMRYLLATSRPTALPVLEFQVALAPAST